MKRFFSFLLFLFLLCMAVAALWVWKNPRYSAGGFDLKRSLFSIFHRESGARHLPEKYTLADASAINPADVNILAAMSHQRVLLAKAVVPSVVSITSIRKARPNSPNDDPVFRYYHHGVNPGTGPTGAQGSGAIVSKEGHIVTNSHVVESMDQIEVELSDGRRKQATLIGADRQTDIAVLKIDADDLQPIPFGDSDAVEVGETVMAIGNPYGLEESVTQGIISAKGRIASSESTNSLFQIDAAINPGNSGGPLVNVRGELIGINEQIYTETGGWQGVGFAIPAATVRRSMDSILTTGRVIHGWLGIEQAQLPIQRTRQRGPDERKGVLVDSVRLGSPAEQADIRAGDLIEKFNDKSVSDIAELRRCVDAVDVNTTATIDLLREGKTLQVQAKIAERPPLSALSSIPSVPRRRSGAQATSGGALDGVRVADLTNDTLDKLGLPDDIRGVLVASVEANSPAADKLRPGDIIDRINQQPIGSPADYTTLSQELLGGEPALLSVMRNQTHVLVIIKPS